MVFVCVCVCVCVCVWLVPLLIGWQFLSLFDARLTTLMMRESWREFQRLQELILHLNDVEKHCVTWFCFDSVHVRRKKSVCAVVGGGGGGGGCVCANPCACFHFWNR